MDRLPPVGLIPTPETVEPERSTSQGAPDMQGEGYQPETEAAEVGQETQPPHDEGRWDHDKSETLARVLESDQSFKENTDTTEALREDLESGKYAFDNTVKEREELKRSMDSLEKRKSEGWPTDFVEASVSKNQKKLINRQRDEHETGRVLLNSQEDNLVKKANHETSPFEKLYDANPDKFADMPTKDFIEIVKEFKAFDEDISAIELSVNDLEDFKGVIERLAKFDPVEAEEHAEKLARYIEQMIQNMDPNYDEDFVNELMKQIQPSDIAKFDMSPRQVMEGRETAIELVKEKLNEKSEQLKMQRQAAFDEHKPAVEPNPQS